MIAIVDEEDRIIRYVDRSAVRKEDIYRVAALWVENSQGEVLIAQRSYTKSNNPGRWGPAVAGTVEKGESYVVNIIKEAEEELGIEGIAFRESLKIRRRGRHQYFVQWFVAVIDKEAGSFRIRKEEVEAVRWISKEALRRELTQHPENFVSGMKHYLRCLSTRGSTTFSSQVYSLLRKVPAGKVTTYKDLANALGSSAYRAVGRAMRTNPDAPRTPCHRVVASDGAIGGYSGSWGRGAEVDRKIALLRKEGVAVTDGKVVDFEKRRFRFSFPA